MLCEEGLYCVEKLIIRVADIRHLPSQTMTLSNQRFQIKLLPNYLTLWHKLRMDNFFQFEKNISALF